MEGPSEKEIAERRVGPHLLEQLGVPDHALSKYGRVPVQIGGNLVWADYVCWYSPRGGRRRAFCVVEVKRPRQALEEARPQAESYAQRLNAPFCCCTDVDDYEWFLTGDGPGSSVRLGGPPSLPAHEFMAESSLFVSPHLQEVVHSFEAAIAETTSEIYIDSKWHHDSTERLHQALMRAEWRENPTDLLEVVDQNLMRTRSKYRVRRIIQEEPTRLASLVEWLGEISDDNAEARIEESLGKNSKRGIPFANLFFVTQLLAGLHPDKYTVIHSSAVSALYYFEATDVKIEISGARDYLYFNDLCRELMTKFSNEHHFNLSLAHNFLWHFQECYKRTSNWNVKANHGCDDD